MKTLPMMLTTSMVVVVILLLEMGGASTLSRTSVGKVEEHILPLNQELVDSGILIRLGGTNGMSADGSVLALGVPGDNGGNVLVVTTHSTDVVGGVAKSATDGVLPGDLPPQGSTYSLPMSSYELVSLKEELGARCAPWERDMVVCSSRSEGGGEDMEIHVIRGVEEPAPHSAVFLNTTFAGVDVPKFWGQSLIGSKFNVASTSASATASATANATTSSPWFGLAQCFPAAYNMYGLEGGVKVGQPGAALSSLGSNSVPPATPGLCASACMVGPDVGVFVEALANKTGLAIHFVRVVRGGGPNGGGVSFEPLTGVDTPSLITRGEFETVDAIQCGTGFAFLSTNIGSDDNRLHVWDVPSSADAVPPDFSPTPAYNVSIAPVCAFRLAPGPDSVLYTCPDAGSDFLRAAVRDSETGKWVNGTSAIPAALREYNDAVDNGESFIVSMHGPGLGLFATDLGRVVVINSINTSLSNNLGSEFMKVRMRVIDLCWGGCSESESRGVCHGPGVCVCVPGWMGDHCEVADIARVTPQEDASEKVAAYASPAVLSIYVIVAGACIVLAVTIYQRSRPSDSPYFVRARFLTKLVREHSILGILSSERGDPYGRGGRTVSFLLSLGIMYSTAQVLVYLNDRTLQYTESTSDRVQEAILAALISSALSIVFGVTLTKWGLRKDWTGSSSDGGPTRLPDGSLPPPPVTARNRAFLWTAVALVVVLAGANVAFALFVLSSAYSLSAFGASVVVSFFVVEPILILIKHQAWNQDTVWTLRTSTMGKKGTSQVGMLELAPESTRMDTASNKSSGLRGDLRDIVVCRAEWESTAKLSIRAPIDLFSRSVIGSLVGVSGVILPISKIVQPDVVVVDITPEIHSKSALAFCDGDFLVNVEML